MNNTDQKFNIIELIENDPDIKNSGVDITPGMWKFFEEAQKIYENEGRDALIKYLTDIDSVDWKGYVAPPEEFFTTGEYLHELECSSIHPLTLEHLCNICDLQNPKHEIIDTGALGTGKSRRCSWVFAYQLYLMSRMNSPAAYYGLSHGDNLTFGVVATKKESSDDLAFGYLKNSIDNSPYFQKYFPRNPRKNNVLEFSSNIRVIPASPMSNDPFIGKNMIWTNLDEISFVEDVRRTKQEAQIAESSRKMQSKAARLYLTSKNRIFSRLLREKIIRPLYFGLYICSSRAFPSSWLEDHIKDVKNNPKANKSTYIIEHAQWDMKDDIDKSQTFTIVIGDPTTPSYFLEKDEEVPVGAEFVDVPEVYRDQFEADIDTALREIAGIATSTVSPLISNKAALFRVLENAKTMELPLRPPFIIKNDGSYTISTTLEEGELNFDLDYFCERLSDGRFRPRRDPNAIRFIHIDYSINNDATGLAMGYSPYSVSVASLDNYKLGSFDEPVKIQQEMPFHVIELILQIIPPKGGQIRYDRIKKLILMLKENLGFPIEYITADQYQSFSELQYFERQGFKVDGKISMDRKPDAYIMLRQAIYENRIVFYNHPEFLRELQKLRYNKDRNKIDHPEIDPDSRDGRGSKDVSDAVAGVVYKSSEVFLERPSIMAPSFSKPKPAEYSEIEKDKMMRDFINSKDNLRNPTEDEAKFLLNMLYNTDI